MRRTALMFVSVMTLVLFPAASGRSAGDLPEGPLILLAEAVADPCSICADQKRKTAFAALNERLVPGYEISSSGACRLVKADQDNALLLTCYPSGTLADSLNEGEELPQVVFTFHTPQKKLVGIAESDCTGRRVSDRYESSSAGTVFEGRIRLVGYKYGDGLVFNYFPQAHRLQIHCAVSELNPVSP